MSNLRPGDEPLPGYRLLRQIGRGGCGVVWRASAPTGEVAIKFVSLDDSVIAGVEKRGLDLIRGVEHPNLIRLHESGVRDGRLILVMEVADGTLHERWEQARRQGLPGIPLADLLPLMEQAACGIDHLNDQQHPHPGGGEQLVSFQHRDVKPRNLLLVAGVVKVGDWGLLRMLEGTVAGHTGALTVEFAAPEFFQGRTTRWSDQYSLAVSYVFVRTGQLPFRGDVREGHLHQAPDLGPIKDVVERQALLRALEKNPHNRWPSCGDFVSALQM